MSDAVGKREWVVPGGRIPLRSTGDEPAMTSRDELRLLNASDENAAVVITVHYGDRDPIGPYEIEVAARRLRRVRVNDLIDPLPVPLETDYALVIRADRPIVVQFTRCDTSSAKTATTGTIAFSDL